jgi:hypothetical protein
VTVAHRGYFPTNLVPARRVPFLSEEWQSLFVPLVLDYSGYFASRSTNSKYQVK